MLPMVKKKQYAFTFFFTCLILFFGSRKVFANKAIPLLPANSSFLDQIDLENYPSLPSPEHPPLLRWNFSGEKVYPYDFMQKVIVTSEMDGIFVGKTEQSNSQIMKGKGKLSLKSEEHSIARCVLEDLTIRMEINLPDCDEPEITQMQAPPMVIEGIKEDGSMEIGNSSQELLFKTLFPIPPIPMEIGNSVTVPVQMPFNAMGSLLHVIGSSEIKLVDYVQIDGKTCAKLETEIDLSTLNVPVEMKGDYQCQVKGRSIFYFNIENRHFMSGKVALLMRIRVVAPTPKMNFPPGKNENAIPETIKMAMDSDNFLSVEYIGN